MKHSVSTLVLTLALVAGGCSGKGLRNQAEAAGEYVFAGPVGAIEVLTVNSDGTYRQLLFPDIPAYRDNGQALHTNYGNWSFKGSTLTFTNWVNFFDFPKTERRLDPPQKLLASPGFWSRPGRDREAMIVRSEDFNYFLFRVKSRADGQRLLQQIKKL